MSRAGQVSIQLFGVFGEIFGNSYWLSGLTGFLTYIAYVSLNGAWGNYVLVTVAISICLSIPTYSRLSNQAEAKATDLTGLGTVGRAARYTLQFSINCALLYVFLSGNILDSTGLIGINGFFVFAAWVTAVLQGGQYLAGWLGARGVGSCDQNVVISISISVIVGALAVSGVAWILPAYVGTSLLFAGVILFSGVVLDIKALRIRGYHCGNYSASTQ